MCSNHTLLQLQTFFLMFALFWPISEVETGVHQCMSLHSVCT